MGLLDYLFDQPNYDAAQTGLLSRLQPSLANVQPSQGFQADPSAPPFTPAPRTLDASNYDPSTFAPNQAQPLAVGNYQMQRIGAAPLFASDPSALPANAQQAQGQMPPQTAPQQPQEPQQLPPALGGNIPTNPILRGLQSFGNGGGLISALTGNYNDPRSVSQQNLKAQYDSLVPVLGPQKAMLAVMNPEAGKTLLTEALTNKEEYGVINEDPLGGKKYGFINKYDHTINGKPIGEAGGAPDQLASGNFEQMSNKIATMRTQGATKEQLLAQIPPGYREDVDSLITGKAVPANMGRAQSRMALLTLAKVVDPGFDETMIPTRIQMRKDFAGEGKNGQAIASFNTAQHHIDKLSGDLETLAKYNGDYPTLNSIRGWLANNANNNPKLRDSMQAVNDDMAAVSHEVANAYNSGHLSDHDMATWQKLTSTNLPPDQLRRGISDFVDLLNGKRDSLNHMYQQTFHEDAPTLDKEKNAAITAKVHQRLPEYARNTDEAQSGAKPANKPASVIQNGHTYTLQPDGSYK